LKIRFLIDELSYDRTAISETHESLYRCLTAEQLNVYENIMTTVHNQVGGFFYMDMAEQAKHLCGKHCPVESDLQE